jgi:hypothetical protein
MANARIQPGRALNVIPSDNNDIPFPLVATSGANSFVSVNQLVDSSANFYADNIHVGDIVYNTSTLLAATVVSVDAPDTITLNADIFLAFPENYVIYQTGPMSLGNQVCVLYIGTGGDLSVTTADNDTKIIFANVQDGTFFPVQVKRVNAFGTTASDIVALW